MLKQKTSGNSSMQSIEEFHYIDMLISIDPGGDRISERLLQREAEAIANADWQLCYRVALSKATISSSLRKEDVEGSNGIAGNHVELASRCLPNDLPNDLRAFLLELPKFASDIHYWTFETEILSESLLAEVLEKIEASIVNFIEAQFLLPYLLMTKIKLAKRLAEKELFDRSLGIFDEVIEQCVKSKEGSIYQVWALQERAETIGLTGELKRSLKELQKANDLVLELYPKHKDAIRYHLFRLLARALTDLGDFHDAIRFYRKFRTVITADNREAKGAYYNGLGTCFMGLGKYPKAIENFEKALEQDLGSDVDPIERGKVYNNISQAYFLQKKFEPAVEWCEKAIAVKRSGGESKSQHSSLAVSLMCLGAYNMYLDEVALAKKYFLESLAILSAKLGFKNQKIAQNYMGLGILARRTKDLEASRNYVDKAIEVLLLEPFNSNQTSFDRVSTSAPMELIDALIAKTHTLKEQFEKEPKPEIADECLSTYIATVSTLFQQRLSYQSQDTKLTFASQTKALCNSALSFMSRLPEDLKDQHIQVAFDLSEMTKGLLLLEHLKEVSAKLESKVPSHLLQEEQRLQLSLLEIEQKIADAETDTEIQEIKDQIFDLQYNQLRPLQEKMRKNYPHYAYSRRPTQVDLKTLSKHLAPDTTLLEYYLDDSNNELHYFAISKDKSAHFCEPVDSKNLKKEITKYNERINAQKPDYGKTGRTLYELLILPFERKNLIRAGEKLIIVPDQNIAFVPFAALNPSADHQQFLIERYQFSLHYSASLFIHFSQNKVSREEIADTFLGIAPIYDFEGKPNESKNTVRFRNRQLDVLYSTENELKQAVTGLRGGWDEQPILLTREMCSKANVIMQMQKSRRKYMHVAAHAYYDYIKPADSGIVLYKQGKDAGSKDHLCLLTVKEIYRMKIDAELVILGCCNSGLGKIEQGEGLTSALNLGFLYSGAKNVIFSLFQIPDKATADVMGNFYRNSGQHGSNFGESLRSAQLEYLRENRRNPEKLHPKFWSGLVYMGL